MTTTAVQEGRQLILTVPGLEPFAIDPIAAKRGEALTHQFVRMARSQITGEQLTPAQSESIFIESLGASVYSRITGLYVDQFDSTGAYVRTYGPDGEVPLPDGIDIEAAPIPGDIRFAAREALPGQPELEAMPVRQEECESLALCAFYWQTVVGMEAVQAFIENGEGTVGSLKAMSLLQIRISASRQLTSSLADSGISTQQAVSEETTAIENSSVSVRLPASKRGFLQNPGKRQKSSRR